MVARLSEALQEQVRQGDDLARLAWADLCEEEGDREAASALRDLPILAEEMSAARHDWLARNGPHHLDLVISLRGRWRWESRRGATPSRESRVLQTFLARGSTLAPALAWLASRLALGAVNDET